MKYLLAIAFTIAAPAAFAQFTCKSISEDQTYISVKDGTSMKLYADGRVSSNGVLKADWKYEVVGCKVNVYAEGKLHDVYTHSSEKLSTANAFTREKYKCDCLFDGKDVKWYLVPKEQATTTAVKK